jgi:Eukaryotic-type carbonic anhydrase
LERGKESDHYDFLELYIRHWRAAAKRVSVACTVRQRRLAAEEGAGQGFAERLGSANFTRDSQTSQSIIRNAQPLARGDNLTLVDDDQGVTFQDDDLAAPNVDDDGPRIEDDLLVSQDGDDDALGIIIQRPYFNRTFQPYDWYAKAKTWVRFILSLLSPPFYGTHLCHCAKYYFRYVGATPEPPCFEGVHWRVLKDPIKVAPSQLQRLEKLLYNRIDPASCKRYTAGTRRFPNREPERLAYNRPLQTVTDEHKLMYCECADFTSRAENDIAYCNLTMAERGVFNFTNSSNGTRT